MRITTCCFESAICQLKQFRCPTEHPAFHSTNCASGFLVVFPREAVSIRHPGCDPVIANPNVVMLYNHGQEYERYPISPRGDRSDFYSVSPDIIAESIRRFEPRQTSDADRLFPFSYGLIDDNLFCSQRWLFEKVRQGHYTNASLQWDEDTLHLVDRTIEQVFTGWGARARTDLSNGSRAHRDLAHAAQTLLSDTFRENRSLSRLSSDLDTSPYHLSRVFRLQTGVTLHQYLIRIRLRTSLEAIAEGHEDLTRLALDLGFSSHSHFSWAFRRAFALTPSQWRKKLASRRG